MKKAALNVRNELYIKEKCTLLFISNTLISNARLKLAKSQANAKQHPESELLLFENYLLSSSMLSSRNNRGYSQNLRKTRASVLMTLYD